MDDIYQQNILDHYKHPRNFGELKSASVAVETNAGCGDTIQMSVQTKGGKITKVKFKGDGCAISIATASMLTDFVFNKPNISINKLTIKDLEKLLQIKISSGREKCATVPLTSLKNAVNKSESKP